MLLIWKDYFFFCLTSLHDISKWNTKNVTNMRRMFKERRNFKLPDISEWDTSSVINMSEMFFIAFLILDCQIFQNGIPKMLNI